MKRFAITTLAALGILLGAVPTARAADATCPPNLSGTTVGGNLVVTGACTLGSDVTVGGNVTVAKGGSLTISPPVKIGGNILTDQGCLYVAIFASSSAPWTIGGNVEIEDCTSGSQSQFIGNGYLGVSGAPQDLKIGGNFTCTGNDSACIADLGSVGGNVQVNDNFAAAVFGNTVGGNLEVNDNTGAPSTVVDNTVGGNAEVDGNGHTSSVTGNTIGGNLTCTGNAGGLQPGGPNTVHGKYLPSPVSQCSN
jgi:hypothetical protein